MGPSDLPPRSEQLKDILDEFEDYLSDAGYSPTEPSRPQLDKIFASLNPGEYVRQPDADPGTKNIDISLVMFPREEDYPVVFLHLLAENEEDAQEEVDRALEEFSNLREVTETSFLQLVALAGFFGEPMVNQLIEDDIHCYYVHDKSPLDAIL